MDQNQIELVTILRDHGIGYEKIATMLEVSTITVRRACAKIENHCAKLLLHLRGEKIPQKVIEEFLESNQTPWDDEWLLRTLISRIYVMPNGKLKIFCIDGTVSRFDMNSQKKSDREKTPTPMPPLPPRNNMPLQPHEPGQRLSDDIKDEICYLRLQGIGYKRIAAELGLSKNTVSSFCAGTTSVGIGTQTGPYSIPAATAARVYRKYRTGERNSTARTNAAALIFMSKRKKHQSKPRIEAMSSKQNGDSL